MATNLFLSGVEAEHAYELALDIERAVQQVGSEEIALSELHSIVEDVLSRADGQAAVERYRAWQKVLRRERPPGRVLGGGPRPGQSAAGAAAGADAGRRQRDRQELAVDGAGLPAGHQPDHLHRCLASRDARILRTRPDAGAALQLVRGGRSPEDADARSRAG